MDERGFLRRMMGTFLAGQIMNRVPNVGWCGGGLQQWPVDMIMLQEVILTVRPHLIIELGTGGGRSALFMANVFDCLKINTGWDVGSRIVTMDVNPQAINGPKHPRITYHIADDMTSEALQWAKDQIVPGNIVMVMADTSHGAAQCRKELEMYPPLVTPGSYFVMQDTLYGWYTLDDYNGGPMIAVDEFLATHPDWISDPYFDRWIVMSNATHPDWISDPYFDRWIVMSSPRGFLKRLR